VGLRDVVDELHNEDSLADSGTAEETDLTTLGVGGQQVDDLDTGHEHLSLGGLIGERGGVTVDGPLDLGVDGTTAINSFTDDVHDTSEGLVTDGDGNRGAEVRDGLATDETISGVEGNATDDVVTQVLGDLEGATVLTFLDFKTVKNAGKFAVLENNVQHGTHNLGDLASGGESTTLNLLGILHTGRGGLASSDVLLELLCGGLLGGDLLHEDLLLRIELVLDDLGTVGLLLLSLLGSVLTKGEVIVVLVAEEASLGHHRGTRAEERAGSRQAGTAHKERHF